MLVSEPHAVTRLLRDLRDGNAEAADRLFPLVYDQLRELAARYMQRERAEHTLQPTALVHEAYLKLIAGQAVDACDRSHFIGIAARAMRQILVDYARSRAAAKRDGGRMITLADDVAATDGRSPVELIMIDRALERLAEVDERQSRVVELRFFGGLGIAETAEVLGVSPATVKRDWVVAKGWLQRELERHEKR